MPPDRNTADRHVAAPAPRDGQPDPSIDLAGDLLGLHRRVVPPEVVGQIPVLAHGDRTVLGDEQVARGQLANPADRRQRGGKEVVQQVAAQRDRVERPGGRRGCSITARSSEAKTSSSSPRPVEQRLLAGPVAAQDQPSTRLVPDGEREHPVELFHQIETRLLIEMRDHLGVHARVKTDDRGRRARPSARARCRSPRCTPSRSSRPRWGTGARRRRGRRWPARRNPRSQPSRAA